MGGRALLVTLVGIMVLSASIFYSITESSESLMKNVDGYYSKQAAQNIAQSGVNVALRKLTNDRFWRAGFPRLEMLDGIASIRLTDTVYKTRAAVKISSTGITNAGSKYEVRLTSVAYVPMGFVPATVKAAITTNNPIKTLGDLTVDGRDHLVDGSFVPNSGTLGVWTTSTLTQSGNSKIGGTYSGIDYTPSKPGSSDVIATNQTWPGGYPGTPDSILGGAIKGYPEGTLKTIAMSGVGGSQYVTDPSLLTSPFRGVTYVELPSGGLWQSMDVSGTGLLIVHNTDKNAAMKNLDSGTFTGLVIADDVVHIHSTIIGGLICLSPAPSEGNCIGNGTGDVYFSTEAITRATGSALTAGGGGSGSGSSVVAWWE